MTDRQPSRRPNLLIANRTLLALAGCAFAAFSGPAACAGDGGGKTEIVVSNSAELEAAVKRARGGETVLLSPGVYEPVRITRATPARPVLLTSRDPAKPAVLAGLAVVRSSGLTFRNLVFSTEGATQRVTFQFGESSDIHLDRVSIHGSLNGDASDDQGGLAIRGGSNIRVTNCEFQQLYFGVAHTNVDGLTISGNSIHDIRADGIRGGGSSNVLVSHNHISSFFRQEKDHPDGIQFWTTRTETSAHDITVEKNVIVRGRGARFQGVFITDQVGNLPYLNVKVVGNLIVGGAYNGIMVRNSRNLEVRDNVVIPLTDQKSWIRLEQTEDAVVAGNSFAKLVLTDDNLRMSEQANQTIEPRREWGGAVREWLGRQQRSDIDRLPRGLEASLRDSVPVEDSAPQPGRRAARRNLISP